MRLTAKSEYGLLAMIDLAAAYPERPVSARSLAQHRGIPQAFLEQLLAELRRAGLVRAARGARGGFTLARDPAELRALDVVEALEGPLASTVCDHTTACSRVGTCAAEHVWSTVSAAVRDVLAQYDLATLAECQRALESSVPRPTHEE